MTNLPDYLTQSGYIRIPLKRCGVGHFHLPATLRGRAGLGCSAGMGG
jgi:hypothetical protein